MFAEHICRNVQMWGDGNRGLAPCYSHLITCCLLPPDTWCPVMLRAAPNVKMLDSRHSFIQCLEENTMGYARTNVIGSRTSFVIASVRSSMH